MGDDDINHRPDEIAAIIDVGDGEQFIIYRGNVDEELMRILGHEDFVNPPSRSFRS